MSISIPPKGTHFSDGVRVGPILGSQYVAGTGVNPSTLVPTPIDNHSPGIYVTPTSLLDITPAAVAAANIAAAQTLAAAGYVALTTTSSRGITWMSSFSGTSGPGGAGVIALDVPRNISITGVTATTAANYTVFGWDQYGIPMAETITGPVGATTTVGVKAWKYIQGIYASAGTTGNITVGIGNVYGLPYFVSDANYILVQNYNGAFDAGTIVVGDPRLATATTGDVRGTYTPASNADGSKRLTLSFYNASGDTRNYYSGISGTIYLGTNAISTQNGNNNLVVLAPGHNLTGGEMVTIAGATTIANVTAAQINITAPVIVISNKFFSYSFSGTAATSTTLGGGSAIQMTPGTGNLYQVPTGRFGVPQYTRVLF